jgi:hypothetical protein
MASIQLTQVNLVAANPPSVYIKVDNSESLLAINPASIAAVGPAYNPDGTIIDVRQVYITGSMLPIYVTDSYATVKAYIDAL